MAPMMEGVRIGRLSMLCAGGLMVMAASPAGAADPAPCRVRNVTQDTTGRSLIRMVDKADDGDRLRVRGTCPGEVVIDVDVLMRGIGERPTLTGRGRTQVVRIRRRATVTLRGLTIQRGVIAELFGPHGAGIANRGRLTLIDSLVRSNIAQHGAGIWNTGSADLVRTTVRRNAAGTAHDGQGGGILNWGSMTLTDSLVVANVAQYSAGISNQGPLLITGSTIARNEALVRSGGIGNSISAVLTLVATIVRDNRAHNRDGGGIWNSGVLRLEASTVTRNQAGTEGGGIWSALGHSATSVTIDAGSSVTGNTPDDCVGTPAC